MSDPSSTGPKSVQGWVTFSELHAESARIIRERLLLYRRVILDGIPYAREPNAYSEWLKRQPKVK